MPLLDGREFVVSLRSIRLALVLREFVSEGESGTRVENVGICAIETLECVLRVSRRIERFNSTPYATRTRFVFYLSAVIFPLMGSILFFEVRSHPHKKKGQFSLNCYRIHRRVFEQARLVPR